MRIEPVTQQEYLAAGQCMRRVYEGRNSSRRELSLQSGSSGLSPRALQFTAEQAEAVRNAARDLYEENPVYTLGTRVEAYGCTATLDILETRADGSVRPLLIQPAYTVKPQAHDILRYQLFLLRKAGYVANGGAVVCLVKGYERGSSFVAREAFVERDCGKHLAGGLTQVGNRISRIISALSSPQPPEPCGQRDKCPACATGASDDGRAAVMTGKATEREEATMSVESAYASTSSHSAAPLDTGLHTLFKGGGFVSKLKEQGYSSLDEVPVSVLPGRRQRLQVQAVKERRRHIDREGLARFCERLRYPRAFLDFETVSQALPPVEGVRAWEHVPIQFSLHRQEAPGDSLSHVDFVADDLRPGNDPREPLAEVLSRALEGAGSVSAFSAAFERRVLSRLAQWVPRFEDEFRNAIEKIVDVQEPFNELLLYLPAQRGKTGLKTILPAVTGTGYEDLDVADGLDASLRWFYEYRRSSAEAPRSESAREGVASALREYCALDTAGLVSIVRYIEGLLTSGDLSPGE